MPIHVTAAWHTPSSRTFCLHAMATWRAAAACTGHATGRQTSRLSMSTQTGTQYDALKLQKCRPRHTLRDCHNDGRRTQPSFNAFQCKSWTEPQLVACMAILLSGRRGDPVPEWHKERSSGALLLLLGKGWAGPRRS